MFCIECGFKSIESAKFCKRCGTTLNQDVNSSQHLINETHNAAHVNNNLQPHANSWREPQKAAIGTDNLQPQTQPQQEPQQADVGSYKYLVTGILYLIGGMFLILFGPFILVGRWPYIGLQLTGIEMLIWINFIFAAAYGVLAIFCRNSIKLNRILSKGTWIPMCVILMLMLLGQERGETSEVFGVAFIGIMVAVPYVIGLTMVLHFYDLKNQNKLQEHEEEK